jgi:hypothetical protein
MAGMSDFWTFLKDNPDPKPDRDPGDAEWTPSGLAAPVDLFGRGANRETALSGSRGLMDIARVAGYNTVLPPPDYINHWRDEGFDTQIFSKISPLRVITILCDISPEVSRALWDYLRFCNPGWEITVTQPGSEKPHARGQAVLDDFLYNVLAPKHGGSLDVVWGRMFAGGIVRGAFLSELVFGDDARTPVDLATPDPAIVRFRKVKGPYGPEWEMGEVVFGSDESGLRYDPTTRQAGIDAFKPYNRETVMYAPVDAMPGNPYGRSLMNPVVFPAVYLISLLNDLKRVTAQQGMPRIDIEVDLQALAAIMPDGLAQDQTAFNRWVRQAIAEVKEVYGRLQPDQAFVHTSMIKVNGNVGTVDVNSLGSVNTIIQALERFMTKALKTYPLFMAENAGMSEANANRQWEVFVQGIKQLQHLCENMLKRQFEFLLRAQGIQANAKIRFAELRTAELLRDAMYKQLHIANTLSEYLIGTRDFDEMAMMLTGHMPPEGKTEPDWIPKNFIPFAAPNAARAEGADGGEGSASPGQEGGDRDIVGLVDREVNKILRRQLLAGAGVLELADGTAPPKTEEDA